MYRDAVSGASTQALLVRLPVASAMGEDGYWAFALSAAYGRCKLEYVTDLKKLASEYGYRAGKHPMIGPIGDRSAAHGKVARKCLGARRDCAGDRSAAATSD